MFFHTLPVHSANCVNLILRRVEDCSMALEVTNGSRLLVAFGNETYELNLTNYDYKHENYIQNLVHAKRFTTRSFGCVLSRALY
jgi:hypothetical protein